MRSTIVANQLAEKELERARGVARQFAADVRLHFGARLKGMRLYGSAARGDWSSESDIDVLVLLDRVRPTDEDWLIHRASELGLRENGLLLQPLFMAESAFAELLARERLFAIEVQREGIDL